MPANKWYERFGVEFDEPLLSAHHNRDEVSVLPVRTAHSAIGTFSCGGVFTRGAKTAAYLEVAAASRTTTAVIGVCLSGEDGAGLDALVASVQIPRAALGAAVKVDTAADAATLAAQMSGLGDTGLAERLKLFKEADSR